MNKLQINLFLIVFFVVGFFGFLVYKKLEMPRVFVLHSYHEEYKWVGYINEGLVRVFAGKNYNIRYYYMNTKRNPDDDYKKRAADRAQRVITRWNPDLLIAFDDDAQKYMNEFYIKNPQLPVIFGGVNADPAQYGYDGKNHITGIKEQINFNAVKDALSVISQGRGKRLYQISDDSRTTALIKGQIMDPKVNWAPFELLEGKRCSTVEDWRAAIREANETADIILVSLYHTIKDPEKNNSVVSPKKIIDIMKEEAAIPGFGLWGMFVEDGGMFSIAVSGFEQGEIPANMAIKILDEKIPPSQLPIMNNEQFLVYVRESRLKRFDVAIPELYSSFAHSTDNYFDFIPLSPKSSKEKEKRLSASPPVTRPLVVD